MCWLTALPDTSAVVPGDQTTAWGELTRVTIKNTGTGPALNVALEVTTLNPDQATLVLQSQLIGLGLIGEETRELYLERGVVDTTRHENPRIEVTLTCSNIYGLRIFSSLQATLACYPGDASQLFWKLSEQNIGFIEPPSPPS